MNTKKVTLELNYTKEVVNAKKNVYKGGVEHPQNINELCIDVFENYRFNHSTDEFEADNQYNIEIQGSNKALYELGKFLVNIALFETADSDFHVHIDGIANSEGEEKFNLKIRKIPED